MKLTDKQALQEWEQYLQSIREETAIDRAMPVAEREKRRQWPLRHIPPRMDQRAVPTPLPHVPGQTSLAAAAAPGQTSLAAAAAPGQTSPAAAAAPGQTSPAAAAAPDDFDTDEECRNPEIIADKWNWTRASPLLYTLIQRALVGYLVRQHHRP